MRSRTVTLAFHKVEELDKRHEMWQTRAGMWFFGQYVHVDLRFEDGTATSIHNKGTVFLTPRALTSPCKKLLNLSVTDAQYNAMREFAVQTNKRNIPFNKSGFFRCAFPFIWKRCDDRSYFCSEYATRLLQQAGWLEGFEAGRMHPTLLMDLMQPHCLLTGNEATLRTASISLSGILAPKNGGYGRL